MLGPEDFPGRPIYLEIAWIPCYYIPIIQSFKNKATEDIFNGVSSKIARKICPKNLWKIAARKLDQVGSVYLLMNFEFLQETDWKL